MSELLLYVARSFVLPIARRAISKVYVYLMSGRDFEGFDVNAAGGVNRKLYRQDDLALHIQRQEVHQTVLLLRTITRA